MAGALRAYEREFARTAEQAPCQACAPRVARPSPAVYRFDFTFANEGEGHWKVILATWKRAAADDFF